MKPLAVSPLEKEIMASLEALTHSIPPGTAEITVSRVPGHEEWHNPYFEIVPTNPLAARICGWAANEDLDITLGEAGHREFIGFGRGGTVVRGARPRQEFEAICRAVMKGGFTERLAFTSRGKLLYSEATINVEGELVAFGISPWLGIRWRSHTSRDRTYEGYVRS
jgi:hypothetical protein